MAIDDALWLLATDYWDTVWSDLNPDERTQLTKAVGDLLLASRDREAFDDAALMFTSVLRHLLPEQHPIMAALDMKFRWVLAPQVDWRPILSTYSAQLASIIRKEIKDRLYASPAMTADQVRSTGTDPSGPSLIRLDSHQGGLRFPAFQFDHDGRPIETVARINERLGAADDPYGAADWWLGDNAWLDAVPADLIGTRDDLIAAAADALVGQEWQ